jgi:hypothetical protein
LWKIRVKNTSGPYFMFLFFEVLYVACNFGICFVGPLSLLLFIHFCSFCDAMNNTDCKPSVCSCYGMEYVWGGFEFNPHAGIKTVRVLRKVATHVNRNRLVLGIATGYGLDCWRGRSSSPVGSRIFSSAQHPDRLCGLPSSIKWVPGVKRSGCEADHSPTTSAEIKKTWLYTVYPLHHTPSYRST